MLKPAALLRIFSELVVALLGLFLLQVAVTGRFFWDRRSPFWLALGVFLIYWGIRALVRASRQGSRREERMRGASLVLVGAMMLAIVRVPWTWVAPLLGIAGVVLTLRGLLSIAVVARTRD